jgi:peptidoglycan/LPS O-acetylase OafA/YrhL
MDQPENPRHHWPKYLHSLDAIRGIAALVVVLYHWQHFLQPPQTVSDLPLFWLLQFFYTDGWRAVDLFFMLSGFIFFWLYEGKISSGRTSLCEFWLLRISRLYPLHIMTLIIVAVSQSLHLHQTGTYFVYQDNDLKHFLLHLGLASNWGFQHGYSFNAPFWSVSVEIVCYAVFFMICFLKLARNWFLAAIILLVSITDNTALDQVERGIFSFFIGGLSFRLFVWAAGMNLPKHWIKILFLVTLSLAILLHRNIQESLLVKFYVNQPWHRLFLLNGHDPLGLWLTRLSESAFELIVFPMLIICLALWELRQGKSSGSFAFLGKISYSSYLLHFPLQLAFSLIAATVGLSPTVLLSPWCLLLFFLVLLPLSLASYRYFERPCQNWIRRWTMKSPTVTAARAG